MGWAVCMRLGRRNWWSPSLEWARNPAFPPGIHKTLGVPSFPLHHCVCMLLKSWIGGLWLTLYSGITRFPKSWKPFWVASWDLYPQSLCSFSSPAPQAQLSGLDIPRLLHFNGHLGSENGAMGWNSAEFRECDAKEAKAAQTDQMCPRPWHCSAFPKGKDTWRIVHLGYLWTVTAKTKLFWK